MSRQNGATNAYGFDFLKTQHLDNVVEDAAVAPIETTTNNEDMIMSAHLKPDLEKQFDVIHFLRAHRSAGFLPPSVIYKAIGIDLSVDIDVAEMLKSNPKIRVEQIPDPENPSVMIGTYAYQAKYNTIRDRTTLLAQINRCKNGVAMRDLLDSYDGVECDLASLITAGDVVAIANTEDKDKILFSRGEAFLVELDGIVAMANAKSIVGKQNGKHHNNNGTNNNNGKKNHHSDNNNNKDKDNNKDNNKDNSKCGSKKHTFILETDVDPRKQIRRGEAINVGGQWFRVSSAVKEGVPLSEQPTRAHAPLSVVSLADLSKRNEQDGYIRPFTEKLIPLDAALSKETQNNLIKAKEARERLHKLAHGRSSISGGAASQLLSSNAHASNPTTLAASFASASSSANTMNRKKPASSHYPKNHHHQTGLGGNNNNGNNNNNNSDAVLQHHDAAKKAASDPAIYLYSHARRHGCTKDVREMYLATRELVPESEADIHALLVEHKLLEPNEQFRRPRLSKRANVDNDGKPKKRRYYERKNQRMTNTHLEGTEAGAILHRAMEKQKQGKSVGDGGM